METKHRLSVRIAGRPSVVEVVCSPEALAVLLSNRFVPGQREAFVTGRLLFGVLPSGSVGFACCPLGCSFRVFSILRVLPARPFGRASRSSVVNTDNEPSACDFTVAETEAYLAGR